MPSTLNSFSSDSVSIKSDLLVSASTTASTVYAGDVPRTPEQQLQSARQEWLANLDHVLDSEADLARQRTRADDLKVELIRIQTPPEPSWPVSLLTSVVVWFCWLQHVAQMLLGHCMSGQLVRTGLCEGGS